MSTIVQEMKKNASNSTHATRNGFFDAIGKLAHVYGAARSARIDDYLSVAGLQRKSKSKSGSLVRFSTGFFVGAGVGLLFAPLAGRDLRTTIVRSLGGLLSPSVDKVNADAGSVADDATIDAAKVSVISGAKNGTRGAARIAKGDAVESATGNGGEDVSRSKPGARWSTEKIHS